MALEFIYDIITFQQKYDISPRLIPSVNRKKELLLKETPTPSELEELNTLSTILEPYSITAEDYNKLFTAVKNCQQFITTDLNTYLNNLFDDYDRRMNVMEQGYSSRTTEIDAWYNQIKASIFDSQYFDFDNHTYRKGFKYEYNILKNENNRNIDEKIINETDGSVYASRSSVKNNNTWTITTICEIFDINVNEIWSKDSNGKWEGVIN